MTRQGEKRQLVPEDSGVYLAPAEKQSLQAISAASGCVWIRVDLQAARDKAELLVEWARQLKFPAHFGANWDAFADYVRDLSWLPARGYVSDCANMKHFSESGGRDAVVLADVLRSAAADWRSRGRIFIVLVDSAPAGFKLRKFSQPPS